MLRFSQEKERIIDKLKEIQYLFDEIKATIEIDESLYNNIRDKIDTGIKKVSNEKFEIAIFGAFSDGKSSILSALTKSLDIPIAPEPTTDKIQEYRYGDYLIVDTPGLFAKDLSVHDEITKKYISEANVVIYVVDASNPIKESHLETLDWLMKDLNKIEASIIVINKMDKTCDLEEEQAFQNTRKIKKDVVKTLLRDKLGIENFDRIVCIAADPYQMGLEEWFKREEEYRRLSRIDELQKLIDSFVESAKDRLQKEAGLSVIRDIIIKLTNELEENYNKRSEALEILETQFKEIENRINAFENDIKRASKNIFDELKNLKSELTIKLSNCSSIDELNLFLSNEFGIDGYIFERTVQEIFSTHLDSLQMAKRNILVSFDNTFRYYSEFFDEFTKAGFKIGSKALSQINNIAILKVRDLLKIPHKFKPWEAVKLAKVLNKLGVILSVISEMLEIVEQIKFKKKKQEILKEIDDIFKELFSMTEEDKLKEYIGYAEIEEIKNKSDLEKTINELKDTLEKIALFKNRLEAIVR